VARHVGEEFVDEITNRGGGEAYRVAVSGGADGGLAAGDVEVGDGVIHGEADQISVVRHSFSIVAPGPENLHDSVADSTVDGGVLHAVVIRILMDERWDEEGAEEFAGHILSEADADVPAETGHSGAVRGMAVGGDRDAGLTGYGDEVEWVDEVAGS